MSFCFKTNVNYNKILRENTPPSVLLWENWVLLNVFLVLSSVSQGSTHGTGVRSTMAHANREQGVSVWPAVYAGSAYMGSQLAFEGLGQIWA